MDNTDEDNYCSLNSGQKVYLINAPMALSTLNNSSNVSTVYQYGNSTPYTFLGPPGNDELKRTDYRATTFGLQTTCEIVTELCSLHVSSGVSTPFHCMDSFSGDVTEKNWDMVYFNDSSMVSNITVSGFQNPLPFGWAALLNQDMGTRALNGVSTTQHGGAAFVALCNTSVYDVAYTSVNGTITSFVPTMSNISVTNIVAGNMAETSIADDYLRLAAAMSVGVTATDAEDLANQLAIAYSKATLAVFSNSIVPSPASSARQRSSMLVTRVTAASLYALITVNLSFVVAGLVLCCLALRDPHPLETRDAQARLGIVGLIADRFEQPRASEDAKDFQDVFGEFGGKDSRVGLRRAKEGGWEYCLLGTD